MRIGRFKVKQNFLKTKAIDRKFYLQMLMTSVIISKQREDKKDRSVEFQAICDQFEDITDGDDVPQYSFKIDKKNNRIIFTKIIQ